MEGKNTNKIDIKYNKKKNNYKGSTKKETILPEKSYIKQYLGNLFYWYKYYSFQEI